MRETNQSVIPCTVAVLTHNSASTLVRALESVKDFAEIIVCDGSSTDSTRAIAQSYGAHILEQNRQFLDERGRIINFSGVRNQAFKAATQPWFFYVDSDEYISVELANAIRAIAQSQTEGIYKLFRRYVRPDGRVVDCATTYPNPSVRLCAKVSSNGFIKTVHERLEPKPGVIVKEITGTLFVPVGGRSGPGKEKGNRYVTIEVDRMVAGGKPFAMLFSYVAFRHVAISIKYAIRLMRILLLCRGVRMPLVIELERHRYHAQLIISLWKARTRFRTYL